MPEGRDGQVLVRVIACVPLWLTFDYLWPENLGEPELGVRVIVPFGHGKRLAIVSEVIETKQTEQESLKWACDRLDIHCLYNQAYQRWLDRASLYQLCPKGDMYELALSWASTDKHRRFRCLDAEKLGTFDQGLTLAFQTKRAITFSTISKYCDVQYLHWRLLTALDNGYIEEVITPIVMECIRKHQPLILREQQQCVVDEVINDQHKFFPTLLFGSTGSGKTEVYLQAAERLVLAGKQVLILVPEIGLTPMWMSRLRSRFEEVAIWHSGLTAREKISVRHRLSDVQVLLGTRSALFLPLDRLGLIVVDEEHDSSFKQQDGVAYSARDMSLLLAQELKVPVILGSATPSLESWRQVQEKNMSCFRLTERVFKHTRIDPEIVDMRGSSDVLSKQLLNRLKETHVRGEQAMLYLNRRGYAPALQCTACGHVPTCKACSLRLTLHRREGLLRCHACDHAQRVNRTCKSCGEQAYLPLGSGTERLETDLLKAMPDLKIARFDRDVIRNAKDLVAVLSQFESGEIDCLIGTQMLVKGHHFPNVTLVGVVNADLGMNMPDFRASERWWQQMTQVFGRTGRGEQAGHVVVQTWSPDAPWFEKLDESKAEEVLNEELSLRQITNFPPYGRWVRVVFSSLNQVKASQATFTFAQALETWDDVKVSGPMPCAMEKLAGRFRFELIIRDESRKRLPWQLLPLLQKMRVPSGVRRKVDVDPQDMM
ncbi:MAG: primosomal protein N' [Ghiorsea sp.]